MKNILLIAIGFILVMGNKTLAQQQSAHFVKSGIIEYDKSANVYALIKREIALSKDENIFSAKAFEAYKKNHAQIQIAKSTLKFTDDKTLFTPIVNEDAGDPNYYFDIPMLQQFNTTYTDINTGSKLSQKKVFEETFLVKDSTAKIKWKITDETRDIQGFSCRRANGLILDSIYVVAFYTDQIPVVGGPESFTGLPGMILQVALPHENVSWIATKITDTTLPVNTVVPPKKGKAVTKEQFQGTLKSAMKNWGVYAQAYLKSLQL